MFVLLKPVKSGKKFGVDIRETMMRGIKTLEIEIVLGRRKNERKLRKFTAELQRRGIRKIAVENIEDFEIFKESHLNVYDGIGLYRKLAVRFGISLLKYCGISPKDATVAVISKRMTDECMDLIFDLAGKVRYISVETKENNEMFAYMLRKEFGISLVDGSRIKNVDLTLMLDEPGAEFFTDGAAIKLYRGEAKRYSEKMIAGANLAVGSKGFEKWSSSGIFEGLEANKIITIDEIEFESFIFLT